MYTYSLRDALTVKNLCLDIWYKCQTLFAQSLVLIGVGTGGARGAMAPTEFIKCILAPPLFTSHAAI